jgi:hypothetical protein
VFGRRLIQIALFEIQFSIFVDERRLGLDSDLFRSLVPGRQSRD